MNKDNQAAILSEYFPHKHFFKMNNRGEEICLIGMDVTNRGKRVSFMKQFPCKKLPNSKLQGFAKEASQDLPHGIYAPIPVPIPCDPKYVGQMTYPDENDAVLYLSNP